MFIAAFDIASKTGCADGCPTGRPRTWTWDVSKAGTHPKKLALFMAYCDRYFAENDIDGFFYESGMTLRAAFEVGTNDETFAMLRGLIGIAEACAARANIPRIEGVSAQTARKHFVGRRSFPKGKSKQIVFDHCKMMRWAPTNLDESDACAIWSIGCAMANPRTAHLSAPLFAGQ